MGLFYVPLPAVAEKVPCRPRLLYIRKTHNKMTVPYGSFLCTINFNERKLTPLATPTLHVFYMVVLAIVLYGYVGKSSLLFLRID